MPTNLPAEARAKWIKVMEARTPEEKIQALQEFISSVPKHKGTENLLLWARRRLSQLREEVEERKKRGGRGPKFYIEKEGAAQIVLIGPPNSGKTSLLSKLTNARVVVKEYPYSTTRPQPGMMKYKDILFQLIDSPSIPYDDSRISWENRVLGLARNADGIFLVVDSTKNPLRQVMGLKKKLESNGIMIKKPSYRITIEKTSKGGVNIVVNGKILDATTSEVKKIFIDYGIRHALVRIWGEAKLDDIEAAIIKNRVYKPTLILLNKADQLNSEEAKRVLSELKKEDLTGILVSARTGIGLDKIGDKLYDALGIIRVYTKQPNGPVSKTPIILEKGSRVIDVTELIHSRIARGFKYAKVWGEKVKYPGMKVGADYVLNDGDIIEIYWRG